MLKKYLLITQIDSKLIDNEELDRLFNLLIVNKPLKIKGQK